MLQQRKFSW